MLRLFAFLELESLTPSLFPWLAWSELLELTRPDSSSHATASLCQQLHRPPLSKRLDTGFNLQQIMWLSCIRTDAWTDGCTLYFVTL
ncbi:hypothetical protein SODALDRAFT_331497, partial [Sodiomyces alkalinus F11]